MKICRPILLSFLSFCFVIGKANLHIKNDTDLDLYFLLQEERTTKKVIFHEIQQLLKKTSMSIPSTNFHLDTDYWRLTFCPAKEYFKEQYFEKSVSISNRLWNYEIIIKAKKNGELDIEM